MLKTSPQGLAGHHPAEASIRDRTGCSVLAVERGEDLLVEFPPDFRFAETDEMHLCGSDEAVRRFRERLSAPE